MKLLLGLAIVFVSNLSASGDKARFDNYRLYSVSVDNELQLRVLKELAKIGDSVSYKKLFY